jgi:serine/threonine protein kinase
MTAKDDSLGRVPTSTGAKARPARDEVSLGDERTSGGVEAAGVDTILEDIEVVDLEARYRVERTLGQGGMGEVLLATDMRLSRKVAIKRILGEAVRSKTATIRFLTEAKAIAALNHPNIVQIYDYGRDKDGPFLILEYVDGGSLADRCKKGAIPLEEAVELACQICDGLAKAHDAGIVHRDIKPANVLLNRDGLPKLADFGLARADFAKYGVTVTKPGTGTPDFMPPEQRRDAAEVDHRSDLWSLAATVYQMVTGRIPKVIRLRDLPAKLEHVLAKSLEDEKDARYQSARELRDALKTSVRAAAAAAPAAAGNVAEGKCPGCGVQNDPNRKFCKTCAATLVAPCLACSESIPVWDEVCGSCGAKQTPLVDACRQKMAARQAEAEGLLGDFEFDRATTIAAQLRDESHPKFKHLTVWAAKFLEQIEKSRSEQTRHALEALVEAGKHEAAHDYMAAIIAIEMVPESLRTCTLPGARESAADMLNRITTIRVEVQRLEILVAQRLAAKQFDQALHDVEALLALQPDREDITKIRSQLIDRQQKQAIARNRALAAARARLAEHDYEGAVAALVGVAASAVTREVVELRLQAESRDSESRMLSRKIKDAVAAKQLDGLLGTVQHYLRLKPADTDALGLWQSLVDRELKFSAEIASRVDQARTLEQACRFDEAVKLLEAIPAGRLSREVVECLDRSSRLGPLRRAATAALSEAQPRGYADVIAATGPYRKALAESQLVDNEFTALVTNVQSAHEREMRRRLVRVTALAAAGIAAVIVVIAAGLWIRSSARASSLTNAIAARRWDDALALDPRNVAALIGRARAQLSQTPADIEGAFADLDRAADIGTDTAAVQAARAEAHAARTEAHATRAREYARADRLDEAAEELTEAVRGFARPGSIDSAREAIKMSWILRAQAAANRGDGATLKRALDAAKAAGASNSRLLGFWQAFGESRIEALDAQGLTLACAEGAKVGLPSDQRVVWWLDFGDRAARPPHESADAVQVAVDSAKAAGLDPDMIATLRARHVTLTGIWLQSQGDSAKAAAKLLEASLLDSAVTTATLEAPENAGLKQAVVSEYRRKFEAAISDSDWNAARGVAAAAEQLDRNASEWLASAIATHRGGLSGVPPDVLGDVLGKLPSAVFASLPPAVIGSLPPLRNSIGIELKLLPAGTFLMGQVEGDSGETLQKVTLTKPLLHGRV